MVLQKQLITEQTNTMNDSTPKSPLQQLINSLAHQINGCGQGQERYILSGVMEYAQSLLPTDQAAPKRDEEIELGSLIGFVTMGIALTNCMIKLSLTITGMESMRQKNFTKTI
jgi:hypothetical protein